MMSSSAKLMRFKGLTHRTELIMFRLTTSQKANVVIENYRKFNGCFISMWTIFWKFIEVTAMKRSFNLHKLEICLSIDYACSSQLIRTSSTVVINWFSGETKVYSKIEQNKEKKKPKSRKMVNWNIKMINRKCVCQQSNPWNVVPINQSMLHLTSWMKRSQKKALAK